MSILMKTNTAYYNERIENNSILLPEMNAVLTAFNVMNIGVLNGADFRNAVLTPEDVVFDKMTGGEPVTIMGFAVDKAKAIDIIVKPTGYSAFIASVVALKTKQLWQHLLGLMDVNGDGTEVILKQSVLDKELEASKIYAVTDKEIMLCQFANSLIELANTSFGTDAGRFEMGSLVNSLIFSRNDASGKSWELKAEGVKGFAAEYYR